MPGSSGSLSPREISRPIVCPALSRDGVLYSGPLKSIVSKGATITSIVTDPPGSIRPAAAMKELSKGQRSRSHLCHRVMTDQFHTEKPSGPRYTCQLWAIRAFFSSLHSSPSLVSR